MSKMRPFIMLFFVTLFVFQLSAQDKKFKRTVKFNGRVQFDYEFLKREKSDYELNGNEFRRVEYAASGKIAPKLKYKVGIAFAHGAIGFRDVYLKYDGGKMGNFAVGSMPEPTGLEIGTSSKYISFFERAMISNLQNFKWGAGFHYENYKILNGKASFQFAVTNNGDKEGGFKDGSLEKGPNLIARVTSAPYYDKENHRLIHLGVNFAKRPQKDLKFRAENHMGEKYEYIFGDADGRTELGFELASTFGPISIQGEYKTQTMDISDKDFNMSGYYVMASYFLTGEHRPYKHTLFGRVKPNNDISNGGFGAIELLVRYSNMTASKDVSAVTGNSQEEINNLTFGLNWYLTSHARLMYNYILTDDKDDTAGKLSGHLIRVAMDF